MSDWTKRDQARADFLNACVAVWREIDKKEPTFLQRLAPLKHAESSAWTLYRDLIDGKEENATLDANRWFCPHCGTERPSFAFQLVGEAVIGIGALQYFNVICRNETCRRLLSVIMVGFIPDSVMVEEARRQMAAHKGFKA